MCSIFLMSSFFFNATAPTEIYTLSLHDALPISYISDFGLSGPANEQKSDDKIYGVLPYMAPEILNGEAYTSSSDIYSFGDRKSTRLNSSHTVISYAVFCLKKKTKKK